MYSDHGAFWRSIRAPHSHGSPRAGSSILEPAHEWHARGLLPVYPGSRRQRFSPRGLHGLRLHADSARPAVAVTASPWESRPARDSDAIIRGPRPFAGHLARGESEPPQGRHADRWRGLWY